MCFETKVVERSDCAAVEAVADGSVGKGDSDAGLLNSRRGGRGCAYRRRGPEFLIEASDGGHAVAWNELATMVGARGGGGGGGVHEDEREGSASSPRRGGVLAASNPDPHRCIHLGLENGHRTSFGPSSQRGMRSRGRGALLTCHQSSSDSPTLPGKSGPASTSPPAPRSCSAWTTPPLSPLAATRRSLRETVRHRQEGDLGQRDSAANCSTCDSVGLLLRTTPRPCRRPPIQGQPGAPWM